MCACVCVYIVLCKRGVKPYFPWFVCKEQNRVKKKNTGQNFDLTVQRYNNKKDAPNIGTSFLQSVSFPLKIR